MKLAVVLCISILFAGCSDPSDTAPETAVDEDVPEPTARDIHGIVVDGTITPLADAQVLLVNTNEMVRTDQNGAFQFSDLEPGVYLVEAVKLGYERTQVDVTLPGDASDVRIQLPRRAGFDPYISTLQWDGLLACSWNVATVFATGCGLEEQLQDRSRQYDDLNARAHWLQSELVWENTQPAGENLCMRHYASSGVGGDTIGDACGTSSQLFTIDANTIEQTGLGNTRGLERVVWVDHLAPNTAGVAVDQRFTVFTHVFHNHGPEPGWQFTVDGEP